MSRESDNCGASLHQKRLLAFINTFLVKNVHFLNNFSSHCEAKLIDFETKMYKLEASLQILEYKLESIPDIQGVAVDLKPPEKSQQLSTEPIEIKENESNSDLATEYANTPPLGKRDPRYEKFFKMVQVGVPVQAVKLKISQEGLDPNMLEQQ